MNTCSVDNCAGAAVSRGWCVMHYTRWRRSPTKSLSVEVPTCVRCGAVLTEMLVVGGNGADWRPIASDASWQSDWDGPARCRSCIDRVTVEIADLARPIVGYVLMTMWAGAA